MFQISLAYCDMVRSLLNLPLPAVLNIDILSHFFLSLQAKCVYQIKNTIEWSLPTSSARARTQKKTKNKKTKNKKRTTDYCLGLVLFVQNMGEGLGQALIILVIHIQNLLSKL